MRNDAPHILLVEEDETLADITSFRLELLGYRVTQTRSGEAALQSAHAAAPDLMIVDLYLPGIDGIELINRLRSDNATAAIPVMVFSVDSDLGVVANAFSAGADDYLMTPYDPAVLQEKIAKLLARAAAAN
jgi:CheY-like chemotaxis protein